MLSRAASSVGFFSGHSLLKSSGRKRLVGQMLAASGPVLVGLTSGEIWTLELHLGNFPDVSGKCNCAHFLPQDPVPVWPKAPFQVVNSFFLSHGVTLPYIAGWFICRSRIVVAEAAGWCLYSSPENPKLELQRNGHTMWVAFPYRLWTPLPLWALLVGIIQFNSELVQTVCLAGLSCSYRNWNDTPKRRLCLLSFWYLSISNLPKNIGPFIQSVGSPTLRFCSL